MFSYFPKQAFELGVLSIDKHIQRAVKGIVAYFQLDDGPKGRDSFCESLPACDGETPAAMIPVAA